MLESHCLLRSLLSISQVQVWNCSGLPLALRLLIGDTIQFRFSLGERERERPGKVQFLCSICCTRKIWIWSLVPCAPESNISHSPFLCTSAAAKCHLRVSLAVRAGRPRRPTKATLSVQPLASTAASLSHTPWIRKGKEQRKKSGGEEGGGL